MYRGKRALDLALSLFALLVLLPVMAAAALAVWLADGVPVLHRAKRVGRDGQVFTMLKFRSMRNRRPGTVDSVITAANDSRVFALGAFLRRSKIDELPQLVNIVRGDMAVIGPRPESPDIVARYYDARARTVLAAPPGLASPGSLYDYTHGPALLAGAQDVEQQYAERVLPEMLALDWVYAQHASLRYDLVLIVRTVVTIVQIACGRRQFPPPPELPEARPVAAAWRARWLAGPPGGA